MKKITRRKFLELSSYSAAALGTPPIFAGCNKKSTTKPIDPETLAQVSAIKGNDLTVMTKDAIDAIGGIEKIVKQGETVFIKPNMVTLPWGQDGRTISNGECTKPEIIIAVAEECLKAGAAEVVIGDGSQTITFNWRYAVTLDGCTNLVLEAQRLSTKYDGKVTLACLENDSPEFVDIPSGTYLNKISISSLVKNADRVISIPVAKTHSWAQLTLGLKNFIGVTSIEHYGVWLDSYWDRGKGLDHSSPQAIAQIYLDVVEAIKPDLTVIDFSIGIEGDGPTQGSGGTTIDMKEELGSWLVLASTDIMAADATAARIMSHNVADQKQLKLGHEMGLGQTDEESIELIGEKLDNIKVNWKPAILKNTPFLK
jgi:uncharacterized protein (DUF362 family)